MNTVLHFTGDISAIEFWVSCASIGCFESMHDSKCVLLLSQVDLLLGAV